MSYVPAWQTDELEEEWVETSPSPPGSPDEALPRPSHSSLNTKRGSLRSLGHGSAARTLPSSRKGSAANSPERERWVSNPFVRTASGMLSPPTSVSDDGDQPRERERSASAPTTTRRPGTFVVKEGEDTHGKAFPINPFAQGKDMFAALPLERMFDPPSPQAAANNDLTNVSVDYGDTTQAGMSSDHAPQREQSASIDYPEPSREASPSIEYPQQGEHSSASATPRSFSSTSSTSPVDPTTSRRLSHQYAPVNPSRLSKSMTPSDNSFTTTADSSRAQTPSAAFDDEADMSLEHAEEPTQPYGEPSRVYAEGTAAYGEERTRDQESADFESVNLNSSNDEQARSGEVDTELPQDYEFTFSAPRPRSRESTPVFEPSLAPLEGGEPSHSTLRLRPAASNVGLRLFRNTYDTVTREHLSALVDSIAIQPSPSPPSMPNAKNLRDWSPEHSESPAPRNGGSVSDSDSLSTPESTGSTLSDTRSSKRLRMTPPTPRGPAALRDWRARGHAMLERIRVTDPELSWTSDSRSGTRSYSGTGSRSDSRSGDSWSVRSRSASVQDGPTVNYSDVVRSPTAEPEPEPAAAGPNVRSNPSTASSTYLHRAENMMSRIKNRVVSPETSTTERSVSQSPRNERRVLSETSDKANMSHSRISSEAESHIPRHDLSWKAKGAWIDEDDMLSEEGQDPNAKRLVPSGLPPGAPTRDDMNRFISTSTVATATTLSTSFVKHSGPRDASKAPGIRMIRPGDVQDVVPERIGKMKFDRLTMRWVREGNSLDRVDEAGESRAGGSEESVDIFAGFESSGSPAPQDVEAAKVVEVQDEHEESLQRDVSSEHGQASEESLEESLADRTPSDSSSTASEASAEETPRPAQRQSPTHLRPPLNHSQSAPPQLRTPGPSAGGCMPTPLRSALRNANSTPVSAMKKRAAWSSDLTPAQPREISAAPSSGSNKRSVSFSDGYIIAHHIAAERSERRTEDYDLFSETINETNASWIPSMRTRRIQQALDGIADLSIDDDDDHEHEQVERSPSPTKRIEDSPVKPSDEESEDTVPLNAFKSFRSFHRAGSRRADQTFLTECSFGVAHDRLVELITDVQPFEPYWEQLRTIDLSNKNVDSLARLKEFLPQLDEAKLNDNAIDYLSGIPGSVRTLHVAGNRLSSLTSVNHLRNLHFLDISRNQLDSVSQLECLRHLRELVIDGNTITDLSGIMGIDCLVKLSVAGNQIEHVNLEHAKWSQLEVLNLSNNKIKTIRGLETLKKLTTLNLDKNALQVLEPSSPMSSVRVLRVSDNDLESLDVSLFPKVRTLFADNNALPGLSRSSNGGHRVENLSLRNQRVEQFALLPEDLQTVKRLYVSGNRLESDFLRSPVYSLVYLEAAACNLTSWPAEFASKAPNLHILNVNYNFLDDLDGLAGLKRLRKLMAVGCRLGARGNAARGLRGLSALEEVDLRMNPATLSFYLPILLPRSAGHKDKDDRAVDPSANWPSLDSQFRRHLPDEWYSKRLVYRGLVMAACPDLHTLDGLRVSESERRKAAQLLDYAREACV